MTYDEARFALHDFLIEYLEARQNYVDAGVKLFHFDKAALVIGSVTPWGDGTKKTNVLFHCSGMLDPATDPVKGWVDACMQAARAERPDVFAELGELVISCLQHTVPGLE